MNVDAILAVMNTTELVVEIGPEKNLGLLQRYSFVNSDQIQRFTIHLNKAVCLHTNLKGAPHWR